MRTRFRDDSGPLVQVAFESRSQPSGSYSTVNYTFQPIKTKKIIDTVTPGRNRILRKGGILPYLPVYIESYEESQTPQGYRCDRVPPAPSIGNLLRGQWFPNGTYYNTLPALPSLDSAAAVFVTNAAIARAKSESWDALTSAAELRKTVGLISHRVNSVFNLAENLARRARRARPGKVEVEFHRLWLEARYGWRPLVYEISDIIDQYRRKPYFREEGRNLLTIDLSASTPMKQSTGVYQLYSGSAVRSGTRTYRGFALATGSFGVDPEFRPFQTAWELLPWSFVVDWFFDVNSWIQAVTPIPGVEVRASGYSVRDEWTEVRSVSVSLKSGAPINHEVYGDSPNHYEKKMQSYQRFPSTVQTPSFVPRLNTFKAVDLLALLTGRLRSLRNLLQRR